MYGDALDGDHNLGMAVLRNQIAQLPLDRARALLADLLADDEVNQSAHLLGIIMRGLEPKSTPPLCDNQVGKFEGQDCVSPAGHEGDCPRVWPLDSIEPREDGLRVRSEVNNVIFRYSKTWMRWFAEQDSGGDGNGWMWSSLNGSNSEFSTGTMVEVL